MKKNIKKAGDRLVKQIKHQPEKIIAPTLAIIVGLIALSMVGSVFGTLVGWFLSSTVVQILSLLFLGFIVYGVLDKGLRQTIWDGYARGVKNVVHRFVEIDPVGVLRDYRSYLFEQLMQMTMQIDALSKQKSALAVQIQDNQEKMEDLIAEAKKPGLSEQLRELKARQLGRLKESNERLKSWESAMEAMYSRLLGMYKTTEIALEEAKQQIEEKEEEYKAITASRDAMQAASEIILGKSAKRRQLDEAVEALANDVAKKVGEMEQFMDESNKFIAQTSLTQAMQTEQGLAMLQLPTLPVREAVLLEAQPAKEPNHYDALFRGEK